MESGGPDSEPIYRSGGGLGVGLSAARQIAALHGGAVMLESRSGKGVRAAFSLPVQPPEGCGTLRTPSPVGDVTGGFSPVLVELADLLPDLALKDGSIAVDRNMATNLPGVFAAGDCTGLPLQVSKAVGEGQVAGHRAAEYLDQL